MKYKLHTKIKTLNKYWILVNNVHAEVLTREYIAICNLL